MAVERCPPSLITSPTGSRPEPGRTCSRSPRLHSSRAGPRTSDSFLTIRHPSLTCFVDRRVFWDNGFKSAAAVANADPKELVPILMQVRRVSSAQ